MPTGPGHGERPERCDFARDDFLSCSKLAQNCGKLTGCHKSLLLRVLAFLNYGQILAAGKSTRSDLERPADAILRLEQAVQEKPPGDEAEGFVEMRPSLAGLNHDNPDPNPTTIHNAI